MVLRSPDLSDSRPIIPKRYKKDSLHLFPSFIFLPLRSSRWRAPKGVRTSYWFPKYSSDLFYMVGYHHLDLGPGESKCLFFFECPGTTSSHYSYRLWTWTWSWPCHSSQQWHRQSDLRTVFCLAALSLGHTLSLHCGPDPSFREWSNWHCMCGAFTEVRPIALALECWCWFCRWFRASEPAIGGHHTTASQGVWYTRAYKQVPTLADVQNHLDYSRPGPIYVVTCGSRVDFFPSP